jgi:steroid delta-isomerase-like uncharacterized protein
MTNIDAKVEANKALMRRFYEEFWIKGNADAADDIIAENIRHQQLPPGWPEGRAGVKELVRAWRRGFPDMREEVELMIGEGDWVLGRFRLTGTHRGEFQGVPPSGRRVDIQGLDLVRIADGRIVEWIYHEDALGLFDQLGVAPPQAVAGTVSRGP